MIHTAKIPTLFVFLFLLIGFTTQAQQAYLTCTEMEEWPKDKPVEVPENHNRVSSYLFLLNKNKYLELFNGVNYNKKLAAKAGLSKNDQLQYLYMGVDFSTPDGDSISVPLFLFDVNDKNNLKKFEQYDGKLLENINANSMHADINGKYKVKAMLSRESSGFWKDLVSITTDVARSASKLMLGNPFGASDLLSCFQGQVSTGLDKLGTLSKEGGGTQKIQQEHSFIINLVKYNKSPEFREMVTSVRLYRVHWSFDKSRGNSTFFERIDANKYPTPEVFEDAVKNHVYPMILVVETRFAPDISSKEPEFTDAYKKEIANEYKEFAEVEQDMFRHYTQNFERAYNISKNLDSYVYNLHRYNTGLTASLLLEIVDEHYVYRQNVTEENTRYNYKPGMTLSKSRYAAVGKRYTDIRRKLEQKYKENEYEQSLVKGYKLLNALEKPIDEKKAPKEVLYNEILTLRYYDEIVGEVAKGTYEGKKSYLRYQSLLKAYEIALYNHVTTEPELTTIGQYQTLIANYPKCTECTNRALEKIQELEHIKELETIQQIELLDCED